MKMAKIIIQLIFLGVFLIIAVNGNMFLWLGLFIISLLGAAMFGRFYCGYLCPMNTTMKVSGKISKRFNWQIEGVPKILKNKWVPLVVFILMVLTMILSKKVIYQEIPVLVVLLAFSLLLTLRYDESVFHNHICPYGALLSITGKYARFSTKVDEGKCIGCKKCEGVCPSKAIIVDNNSKVAKIKVAMCHQCQECTVVCPTKAINYR